MSVPIPQEPNAASSTTPPLMPTSIYSNSNSPGENNLDSFDSNNCKTQPAAAAASSSVNADCTSIRPPFKYSEVICRGIDVRHAPFAGVVAPDVVGTEDQDEPDDLLAPAEEHVFGVVPASLVQMPLMQQVKRIPFFFLLCITIQCFVLNFTTVRYPDPATQKQLPDLGFSLLPPLPEVEQVTATCLLAMNVIAGIVVVSSYRIASKKQEPAEQPHVRGLTPRRYLHKIVWIRWWTTFAIASLLRAVTIIMTTLPSTNNECKTRPKIDNIWINTLKGVYSMGTKNVHCGDLLFSGHTVAIFNDFMTCWTYGPLVSRFVRPIVAFTSGTASLAMLISRSHYSDDIIVAIIVVASCYLLIGHNPKQGAPLWVQAFLRPINTLVCIVRGHKSALQEQSTPPAILLAPSTSTASTSSWPSSDSHDNNSNLVAENRGITTTSQEESHTVVMPTTHHEEQSDHIIHQDQDNNDDDDDPHQAFAEQLKPKLDSRSQSSSDQSSMRQSHHHFFGESIFGSVTTSSAVTPRHNDNNNDMTQPRCQDDVDEHRAEMMMMMKMEDSVEARTSFCISSPSFNIGRSFADSVDKFSGSKVIN